MQCSKNHHFSQLVALFDRLRALAEHGDGFTIVPRAETFGSAIFDLAQPFSGKWLRIFQTGPLGTSPMPSARMKEATN
jgi:hypothetical protein